MDLESFVYGCIKDRVSPSDVNLRQRRCINKAAILSLPRRDTWPYLSADIFSSSGEDELAGTFYSQIIHFGASYHAVEQSWGQWIDKFEELLQKMYWSSVVVHLETEQSGNHIFTWESSSGHYHEPNTGSLELHREWVREGSLS